MLVYLAIQRGILGKMESDLGKLFIGGISWDTDEDGLKEHFRAYGEVLEAMIMRDRTTGRARGFGFIVFADPVVAERVVMEKHMIDGRNVSNFFPTFIFILQCDRHSFLSSNFNGQ